MIAISRISVSDRNVFVFLLLIGLLCGAVAFTSGYFTNSNVLMGLFLAPLSVLREGRKRNNLIYATTTLSCALLTYVYGLKIFYFFTLASYFLWLTEFFYGKLNTVIIFLLAFMSPIFIQVVTILGFPLRLLLSDWAGAILRFMGTDVRVEGNMMVLEGVTFSVDEACMGLNMMATSMLMGVSVLAFRYRVSKKRMGFYSTALFFMLVFLLNLLTNLVRIISLVYFKVPPEDPMHEFIGIACLAFYVAIPLYFLSGWLVRKLGSDKIDIRHNSQLSKNNLLLVLLPATIVYIAVTFKKDHTILSAAPHADLKVNEGITKKLDDGITKISSADWLIYIKTIPEFFSGEHTPLMCWKGSGYKFSGITVDVVGGVTIYKGVLEQKSNKLYTAWWYDNGKTRTISQVDWRVRMLQGEKNFCLVNVTSQDEQRLLATVRAVLQKEIVAISDQ